MLSAEIITIFALLISILVTTVSFNIRQSRRIEAIHLEFTNRVAAIQLELTSSIGISGAALVSRIGIEQQSFHSAVNDAMTKLHEHMLYCERSFVSKNTFNLVVDGQSKERKEMKEELLKKMDDLQKEMKALNTRSKSSG